MRYLTIALTKGRLAEKTLEMLEAVGITCEEMKDKKTRKLIFVNEELKLRFFLAKGPDVPTYVEYGAADHWCCGTRHDPGRRKKIIRSDGSWLWQMQNVYLRTGISERTVRRKPADPCGNEIPEYCKRLFL